MKVGTFIPIVFDPESAARWWVNVPAAARGADELGRRLSLFEMGEDMWHNPDQILLDRLVYIHA